MAAGGGNGGSAGGPCPSFFHGDGAGGGSPPHGGCLGREKFMVLDDLGFLSLYRFPNSRNQIFMFQ